VPAQLRELKRTPQHSSIRVVIARPLHGRNIASSGDPIRVAFWGFLMPRLGRYGPDSKRVYNRYVNVNHKCSFPHRLRGSIRAASVRLTPEQPPALVGKEVNLTQHDFDILALLLKLGPAPLQPGQEFLELLVFVA